MSAATESASQTAVRRRQSLGFPLRDGEKRVSLSPSFKPNRALRRVQGRVAKETRTEEAKRRRTRKRSEFASFPFTCFPRK